MGRAFASDEQSDAGTAGRRMPADSLRVLADASEALGIEGRRDARQYTSLVALNRFVDAVRPESERVRHWSRWRRRWPPNPETASGGNRGIARRVTAWAANDWRCPTTS